MRLIRYRWNDGEPRGMLATRVSTFEMHFLVFKKDAESARILMSELDGDVFSYQESTISEDPVAFFMIKVIDLESWESDCVELKAIIDEFFGFEGAPFTPRIH